MKMKKFSQALVRTAVFAGLVASMGAASAATYQFYNGSTLYASMVTSGGTNFSMTMANAGGSLSSTAYIDYLNLAGPAGTGAGTPAGFAYTGGATATLSSATYSSAGFNDQGDTYNWKLDWQNANNSGRFTVGETVTWSITVTNANAWNFNKLHVNAFDGANSIKLNSCEVTAGSTACNPVIIRVPEPGSLALVGLALLAGGLARRSARSMRG